MQNICKTVTLRTRKIKNGMQLSFYLDYYPGYRDAESMKVLRHELLGIPCDESEVKKAFLFACLTGLCKSDIKALTWNRIQPYGDGGMYISVRMQKTKQIVNNPVSNEALELIGFYDCAHEPEAKVFPGFKDE